MQQQPQLQGVADLLANQGRYGDSMLVHMNPVEVQGLASMSPTGSLTVNPQTGQPEAFLPFLAPLLGGMLGTSALAGATIGSLTLSPAVAGAIGSGLATAAAEGIQERFNFWYYRVWCWLCLRNVLGAESATKQEDAADKQQKP